MHVKGVIIVEKIFLVDLWGKLPQLIENVSDPDPGPWVTWVAHVCDLMVELGF